MVEVGSFLSSKDKVGKDSCGSIVVTQSLKQICKDKLGFRGSLSEYTYSSNSYIFGLMYGLAAMMFLFNGAVYLNQRPEMQLHQLGSWFNIVIGLSLIGVVFSPKNLWSFGHYLFTFVFFGGNIIALGWLPNSNDTNQNKRNRKIAAVVLIVGMPVLLWFDIISVLVAEWISLTVIAIHLFLVAISGTRSLKFSLLEAAEGSRF